MAIWTTHTENIEHVHIAIAKKWKKPRKQTMKKTIEIIKLGNPEFNNKYEKPQKKPKHIRKVDWEGKRNGFTSKI